MRLVRGPGLGGGSVEHAALIGNVSVLAEETGRLLVYTAAATVGPPAAQVAGEPLSYLGDRRHPWLRGDETGAASLLDLSTPSAPKLQPISALGPCPRQVAVAGSPLRRRHRPDALYRPADGRLLLDWAPPAGSC